MKPLVIPAYAKTNLSLRILGKRPDGFHEVRTLITLVSLADTLEFHPAAEGTGLDLVVDGADWEPEPGQRNLVECAWDLFAATTGRRVDVAITLAKRIPSGAGLGGGSSNAAATLRALDQMADGAAGPAALMAMAAQLGSDVPFFLDGRMAECGGRGERIVPVDDDWELPVVLLKPAFSVPTPEAYRRWPDAVELTGVCYVPQVCPWGEMVNDLERPVFEKYPVLADMKMWLLDQPEVHAALMSGSGSTLLAVLNDHIGGEALAGRARGEFGAGLWTHVGQTYACPPGID